MEVDEVSRIRAEREIAEEVWQDEFLLFYPVEDLLPIEQTVAVDVWTQSGRQLRVDRQRFEAWQARQEAATPVPVAPAPPKPDLLAVFCLVVFAVFLWVAVAILDAPLIAQDPDDLPLVIVIVTLLGVAYVWANWSFLR